MSKSNTYEIDLLNLLLCAKPISQVADNASSSAITALWASLHTADPAETGNQSSNETSYSGYSRVSVTRSTAGWSVSTSDGTASPVSSITFGAGATTSTGTLTHMAIGLSSAGTGKIFYSGAISPNINFGSGISPRITTGSSVTED